MSSTIKMLYIFWTLMLFSSSGIECSALPVSSGAASFYPVFAALVGQTPHTMFSPRIKGGEIATRPAEKDSCDPSERDVCLQKISETPVGLPSRAELDAYCRVYNLGMSCVDVWVRRCPPADGQKLVQQQEEGVREVMRLLCANEPTALRREYLKEQKCWARVSAEWSYCVNELQTAAHNISVFAQLVAYRDRNDDMCRARDEFISCVEYVVQPCSASAGGLLQRLARVLTQDLADCSPARGSSRAPPALSTPLLLLTALIIYLPRMVVHSNLE